jgi:hypothetical protein
MQSQKSGFRRNPLAAYSGTTRWGQTPCCFSAEHNQVLQPGFDLNPELGTDPYRFASAPDGADPRPRVGAKKQLGTDPSMFFGLAAGGDRAVYRALNFVRGTDPTLFLWR